MKIEHQMKLPVQNDTFSSNMLYQFFAESPAQDSSVVFLDANGIPVYVHQIVVSYTSEMKERDNEQSSG